MAAHQQITHDWWQTARDRFDLYISEAVLSEIRGGDADAAVRRLETVAGLPVLATNEDVRRLVREYDQRLGLIGRARADLPHFAFAVAYEMDYLVTWNCRHIANGEIIRRLLDANAELNRSTPLIVTPEEILDAHEAEP
jgi:hypothetical protein